MGGWGRYIGTELVLMWSGIWELSKCVEGGLAPRWMRPEVWGAPDVAVPGPD